MHRDLREIQLTKGGREAAAAVGVDSRENASSSGCKDTTRSGGDGGDPWRKRIINGGKSGESGCVGSRDQGAQDHSAGRSGKLSHEEQPPSRNVVLHIHNSVHSDPSGHRPWPHGSTEVVRKAGFSPVFEV